MRYGDLEGKGRFYDDEGAPVLRKGEQARSQARLRFGVYRSLLGSKPFLLDFYEGTVHLTDRRIIGIRKPDPEKAALARLSYTADLDVLETAERAKLVLEKGGFEFFSLDLEEIKKIRKYRLYRAIEIIAPDRTGGHDLHINIAPEKRFRDLFGEERYEHWLDTIRGKK